MSEREEVRRLLDAAEREWSPEEVRLDRLLRPTVRVRLDKDIRIGGETRFKRGDVVWVRMIERSGGTELVRITENREMPFEVVGFGALRDIEGATEVEDA